MDITTEDGKIVHKGDRVYNYYDMVPGAIQSDPDDRGWFYFINDGGERNILNGQRICTMEYAISRGFRGAA